jgi:PadR family transcriptional regulator PadR
MDRKIACSIEQMANRTLDVKPGLLFPALHRLEEQGWLSSEWGESQTRRVST